MNGHKYKIDNNNGTFRQVSYRIIGKTRLLREDRNSRSWCYCERGTNKTASDEIYITSCCTLRVEPICHRETSTPALNLQTWFQIYSDLKLEHKRTSLEIGRKINVLPIRATEESLYLQIRILAVRVLPSSLGMSS
jgi:hypothetical protein